MTALGDHAIAELDLEGVQDPARAALITIVGTYASFTTDQIADMKATVDLLLQFKPLSPLTDDPAEWLDRSAVVSGQAIWQSKRRPDAWTYDATFATYFLLSQRDSGGTPTLPTIPAGS
jgi:hypothetical protein